MSHSKRWTRTAIVITMSTVTLLGACAKGGDNADSTTAAATTPPAMADSGMAGHDMSGMAGMTGNADQDFLRMMNDHHKGLLAITAVAKARTDGQAVVDAKKLDSAQTAELDHMTMMLRQDFKDSTVAKVIPRHQQMADELRSKSGTAQDREFYQNVIAHHQEALKMVDDYLPKAKNTMIKGMAEKMKADQAKEIAEFQRKLTALGS